MNFENQDMINFIQGSSETYMRRFEKMKEKNKPYSWNWPAFLFGGYWLIYRKMYALGIGVSIISILLNEFTKTSFPTWIISVIFGVFGNYLYLNYCNKKLATIVTLEAAEKQSQLLKQGGTSLKALILVIALIFIISFISTLTILSS